jgi:hypothetical protein
MKKQTIFEDHEHQAKARAGIEATKKALQSLLDAWNAEDIGRCENLFQLTHTPEQVYRQTVEKLVTIPATNNGRFEIDKRAYLSMLNIPTPDKLYKAAGIAKGMLYVGYPDLWSVSEDGSTVELNSKVAEEHIHYNDIVVENQKQQEFVKYTLQYIESGKYLHGVLMDLPGAGGSYTVPFQLIQKGFPLLAVLELEPIMLKMILEKLQ